MSKRLITLITLITTLLAGSLLTLFARGYQKNDFFYGFNEGRIRLVKQLTGKDYNTLFEKENTVLFIDTLLTDDGEKMRPQLNNDFAAFLREDNKGKIIVDKRKNLQLPGLNDQQHNQNRRTKSKLALKFLVNNKYHVHFAIDIHLQAHMAHIVSKHWQVILKDSKTNKNIKILMQHKEPNNPKDKNRIITHSELRYAYRHRDEENFDKNIHFWYENDKQTFAAGPPPWKHQAYKDIWEQYKPSSNEKNEEDQKKN
ncbi:MAG: hypothetical protein GY754_45515 [bacterium]|nr:hypothetical protein [bacterium]